jgi:SAM-dependent methyltransferase
MSSPDRQSPSGDHAKLAYDAIAPGYDLLTGAHDHAAWALRLEGLALDAGLSGRRLLDVGCGTGGGLAAMLDRGYDVVGIDVSEAMLQRARQKLGARAALHCEDMRRLPRIGAFDLIWSVADAVNCLDDERELVAAFAGWRRNLAPGGVVVFDVDTLASFRTLYSSLWVVPAADTVMVFDGRAEPTLPAGAFAEAYVDRLERGEPPFWRRARAVHRQRHHPTSRLESALAAADLELVAVWGADAVGACERPLDEARHNKAVYVARAAAPDHQGR